MNAAQGIEFRRPLKTSHFGNVLNEYRKEVPCEGRHCHVQRNP